MARGVHVGGIIGIAAPVIGAHADAVEPAARGALETQIQAKQFGAFAQVHHAAVRIQASADARAPAVAHIHAAGKTRLGVGHGCGGLWSRGRCFRRGGLCFRNRWLGFLRGLCIRSRGLFSLGSGILR